MNSIKTILDSEKIRIVHQEEYWRIVSVDGDTDLENYITIESKNDLFNVYENHRDNKILKVETDDYEKAIIWGIVAFKKLNDAVSDRQKARLIRKSINDGDMPKAVENFVDFKNLFCVNHTEKDKICIMIFDNSFADVILNDKKIVEGASISRAFVTAYNYCKNYEEILRFFDSFRSIFNCFGIYKSDMVNLYMF